MTLSDAGMRRLEAMEILATTPEPRWSVFLPIRTASRANQHVHWRETAKTAKAHRAAAQLVLSGQKSFLRKLLAESLVVRVVRVAPRELDGHDNLGMSLKAITDGVADVLGINDRDPRVRFVPDAEQSKTVGVRIEFYEGPTP